MHKIDGAYLSDRLKEAAAAVPKSVAQIHEMAPRERRPVRALARTHLTLRAALERLELFSLITLRVTPAAVRGSGGVGGANGGFARGLEGVVAELGVVGDVVTRLEEVDMIRGVAAAIKARDEYAQAMAQALGHRANSL